MPLRDRPIVNPLSLLDLSVQAKSTRLEDAAVAESVVGAAGIAVCVGVGAGVELPSLVMTLNTRLVAKISGSIMPDVENADRSDVDVTMQYCTAVPATCGGMVAE